LYVYSLVRDDGRQLKKPGPSVPLLTMQYLHRKWQAYLAL